MLMPWSTAVSLLPVAGASVGQSIREGFGLLVKGQSVRSCLHRRSRQDLKPVHWAYRAVATSLPLAKPAHVFGHRLAGAEGAPAWPRPARSGPGMDDGGIAAVCLWADAGRSPNAPKVTVVSSLRILIGAKMISNEPHAGQRVISAGVSLEVAKAAVIMVHGRGATAQSILDLHRQLAVEGVAYLAPQASESVWYPYGFLHDLEGNEPWLSSALDVLASLFARLYKAGIRAERTALLGFSQGASLVLEYAARHATRFGAIIGLSGGLIGPPGTPRSYVGNLAATPVLVGCSDDDQYIPQWRVLETAEVLTRLGAQVDLRIYKGLGHSVNGDELTRASELLRALVVPA